MDSPFIRASTAVVRSLARVANVLFPGKRNAALLLVANARTRAALPVTGHRVDTLVENGLDLSLWTAPLASRDAGQACLRLVFMGRLIDLKAVDLLIEAFRRASRSARISLSILGDGPEQARLEAQAADLKTLSQTPEPGRISFLGWRSQKDCAGVLAASDVLVLPSLHECGGAVVLEAMATGLPVIATDWGGPADYIDPSCGILVPPVSRDGFISGLAEAILKLAASPELRTGMGESGRRKAVEVFDWERKADRMIEHYRTVANAGKAGS